MDSYIFCYCHSFTINDRIRKHYVKFQFPQNSITFVSKVILLFVLTLTSFISDKIRILLPVEQGFLLWTGILAKVSPAIYISLFIICQALRCTFIIEIKEMAWNMIHTKPFQRIHFWTFSFLLLTLAIELVHQFNQ